jgi:hypothetical protein
VPGTVVLSYFDREELPRLLSEARRAKLPGKVRVYVGSYGVGAALASRIAAADCRYAPMFHLAPGWYWERRRVSRDDAKKLLAASPSSERLAGPLPELPELLRLQPEKRLTWGIELGRRFRDELRAASKAGVQVSCWQLDEIQAEAAGSQGREYRDLTRGALRGLVFGRPALGDRAQQGFVWWAHTALSLPRARLTPELSAFWTILNRAALGLVGEEYPEFTGDPTAAARANAVGQRGLAAGGPVRQALGRKYLTGLTPGYRRLAGLRGNVHNWPRERVQAWRQAYLRARAANGVAGFSEFDFRFENNQLWVMRDVLGELAQVV